MRWRILGAVGVLWLTGCTQDPLAEHSVYWGLTPFERPTGPLVRVLDTDSATPDKQGLLYTSMRDAEVAATYAGRALARLDEPGETESALGEVIYAIEPAEAPAWNAEGHGFGPNWASHGYGLQRSLNRMADEVAAATERDRPRPLCASMARPRCAAPRTPRGGRIASCRSANRPWRAAPPPRCRRWSRSRSRPKRSIAGYRRRARAAAGCRRSSAS